jgi:hypothetical protein
MNPTSPLKIANPGAASEVNQGRFLGYQIQDNGGFKMMTRQPLQKSTSGRKLLPLKPEIQTGVHP